MMYKGSLILQHSELKNEPKQATVSLAREGNSNMGKKKLVHKQFRGEGGKKEKEKATTRTPAAGAQGLGRTLAPQ